VLFVTSSFLFRPLKGRYALMVNHY